MTGLAVSVITPLQLNVTLPPAGKRALEAGFVVAGADDASGVTQRREGQ
jgi:hypothetical protein